MKSPLLTSSYNTTTCLCSTHCAVHIKLKNTWQEELGHHYIGKQNLWKESQSRRNKVQSSAPLSIVDTSNDEICAV